MVIPPIFGKKIILNNLKSHSLNSNSTLQQMLIISNSGMRCFPFLHSNYDNVEVPYGIECSNYT
jgi:hypothetical protein